MSNRDAVRFVVTGSFLVCALIGVFSPRPKKAIRVCTQTEDRCVRVLPRTDGTYDIRAAAVELGAMPKPREIPAGVTGPI